MNIYEKALGVFRWVHNKVQIAEGASFAHAQTHRLHWNGDFSSVLVLGWQETEWKTKGIQDGDVSIQDFEGATAAEKADVTAYKLSVLNNIGVCSRKMSK